MNLPIDQAGRFDRAVVFFFKDAMAKRARSGAKSDVITSRRRRDNTVRGRIPTRRMIRRLAAFVNGDIEMTAPQVTVALSLLKKSLPDLPTSDAKHTVKRGTTDYSRDELVAILDHARDGGGGTSETP